MLRLCAAAAGLRARRRVRHRPALQRPPVRRHRAGRGRAAGGQPAGRADPALVAVVRLPARATTSAADDRPALAAYPRGRGRAGAGPFRALQLRGRDPPVLPRPGDGRHRHAPVPGSADRRAVGLPLLRRAGGRDVHSTATRTGRSASTIARTSLDPGAASAAAIPDAKLPERLAAATGECDPERRFEMVEAVMQQAAGYRLHRLPAPTRATAARTCRLAEGRFEQLAVRHLPLDQGCGRALRPLAGDDRPARHQDRQQGGRADPQERLDRGHRDLARRRRRRAQPGQRQAGAGQHHPQGRGLGRPDAAAGAGPLRRLAARARRPARPHPPHAADRPAGAGGQTAR